MTTSLLLALGVSAGWIGMSALLGWLGARQSRLARKISALERGEQANY